MMKLNNFLVTTTKSQNLIAASNSPCGKTNGLIRCHNHPSCLPVFTFDSKSNHESENDDNMHLLLLKQKRDTENSFKKILFCEGKTNEVSHVAAQRHSTNNEIEVYDMKTTHLSHKITMGSSEVLHDFSPRPMDSTILALVYSQDSRKFYIFEYDLYSGELSRKIRTGLSSTSADLSSSEEEHGILSCSPGGKFVTVGFDTEVKVIDCSSGKRLHTFSQNSDDNAIATGQLSNLSIFESKRGQNIVLTCTLENNISVHSFSSKSKKNNKDDEPKSMVLLLDNEVGERTNIIGVQINTEGTYALVTCADGTVTLFSLLLSENEHEMRRPVSTICIKGTGERGATERICLASFNPKLNDFITLLMVNEKSGKLRSQDEKFLKDETPILDRNFVISSPTESLISSDADFNEKTAGEKTRKRSATVLGPTEVGAESQNVTILTRPSRRTKTEDQDDDDSENESDDDTSLCPVQVSLDDTLLFSIRQNMQLYYSKESDTDSSTSHKELGKEIEQLEHEFDSGNINESARKLSKLISDALSTFDKDAKSLPKTLSGSISLSNSNLVYVLKSIQDVSLLSSAVEFLSAADLTLLLSHMIHIVELTVVNNNRGSGGLWSERGESLCTLLMKRIMIEIMKREEGEVKKFDLKDVVRNLKGKIEDSAALYQIVGRLEILNEEFSNN